MISQIITAEKYQRNQSLHGAIVFYESKYHVISGDNQPLFERMMQSIQNAFKASRVIGRYSELNQNALDFLERVVAERNSGKTDGIASLLNGEQ